MHFWIDYPSTVALLASCLRPRGLFVQWDWEFDAADEEPFGLTREAVRGAFTSAHLDTVFLDTGFSVRHDGVEMSPLLGIGRLNS